MRSKVQKWGNSKGIRIPKVFLDAMKLDTDELVEIKNEEDKIIITKATKKNVTLQERIDAYVGSNLAKDFKWDEAQGKEIW